MFQKTKTNRFVVINSVFERLQGRIRHLHRLSQFTPRYVPQILTMWREPTDHSKQGLEISTQIQAFSVLSWFWKMHGIKVGKIRTYLEDSELANSYRRTHVATRDKSWAGHGIDVVEIIEQARAIDPVVARLLELARSFGLRANETLRLRPGIDDKLDHLHVHRGTKTGRPRIVEYDTFEGDLMRQAIASVKSELGPTQHAAWEDRTLAQGRRRLYYVLSRIGITKKGLGVTIHGLRAQWAIETFEKMTGAKAPVRGGQAMNYRQFSDVRLKISQALGHNRINVTAAYYGSFFAMKQPAEMRFRASWKELEPHLPAIQDALKCLQIDNLWLVGPRANGANSATNVQSWEFLLDERTPASQASEAKTVIEGLLDARGLGVVFVHAAASATPSAKQRWQTNALPLFDVEAPLLQDSFAASMLADM